MQQGDITIKGIRHGLLIGMGEGPWPQQMAALEERLVTGAAFFQGGRAALDIGDRSLGVEAIEQVGALLEQYEVELWALLGSCDETALAAARHGLAINLELGDRLERLDEISSSDGQAEGGTLLVDRTLRSGQKVHHSGHVVVLGDVNSGAEVIAGGHIVVWGRLRGFAHAGVMGDESAVVCALELSPTQLRIAKYFSRSPDEKQGNPEPEKALIKDNHIEAVPWHQQ
jgi:septum site-determining protein MinC